MLRHYPLTQAGVEDQSLLPWNNGNPGTGVEGSYPSIFMMTEPMEEILSVVYAWLTSGPTASLTNLRDAIDARITNRLNAIGGGSGDGPTYPSRYFVHGGVNGGTVNAITAALDPGITAYEFPSVYIIRLSGPNTGPATANLDGKGARPILSANGGQALSGGEMSVVAVLIPVDGNLILLNPQGGTSGSGSAGKAFNLKTFETLTRTSISQSNTVTIWSGTYAKSSGSSDLLITASVPLWFNFVSGDANNSGPCALRFAWGGGSRDVQVLPVIGAYGSGITQLATPTLIAKMGSLGATNSAWTLSLIQAPNGSKITTVVNPNQNDSYFCPSGVPSCFLSLCELEPS